MQKNEIKNFICSFLLSLLTVAAVSKGISFISARQTETPNNKTLKIKPISLFREPEEDNITSVANSAVVQADFSALEQLTVAEKTKPDTPELSQQFSENTVLASREETFGTEYLPETSSENSQAQIVYTPEVLSVTDLALSEEIILEPTEINESDEENFIKIADAGEISTDNRAQNTYNRQVVYSSEENIEHENTEAHQILASLETEEQPINNIEEQLIPIETNNETVYTDIHVLHSANASQIAMLEPNTLVNSINDFDEPEEKTLAEANLKQSEWTQMSEKVEDNPWIIAKGNKFAKNKAIVEQYAEKEVEFTAENDISEPAQETDIEESNIEGSLMLQENTENETEENNQTFSEVQEALQPQPLLKPIGNETKLAYQMIDNLFIPIPEDIKNDANLTPDLSVTPGQAKTTQPSPAVIPPEPKLSTDKPVPELNDADKESGLFKSITNWFSSKPEQQEATPVQKQPVKKRKNKTGITQFQNSGDEDAPSIVPAELRLSFQPNRAEISGQTLRWIHAFADNARDNDGVYIEIRIDGTSSFALQQKRLNLLSTILANRGVDFRKINIIFTSREPNSFIIRNIRFSDNAQDESAKDKNKSYYQPW